MAIGDPYATPGEYREVKAKDSAVEDEQLLLDLLAVSRLIDHRLGRHFSVDVSDVARVIAVPEKLARADTLWVPDLSVVPTSIKIDEDDDGSFADEAALAASDYELWPLDAAVGPEVAPYTHIVLTRWGTKHEWPAGGRVEVRGKWGWPSVPGAVKRACIELTAILRVESPYATSRIDEMGTSVAMSREAQRVLAGLMDRYARFGTG